MAEITRQQSPIFPEDGSGSNDFDSMFALVLQSGSRENPSELDPVASQVRGGGNRAKHLQESSCFGTGTAGGPQMTT